ncbi:MAG: hypothetical protein HOJ56_02975 [Acidimicrobiaceae bacterium]|nr:hypothetical protein [Acidimicrobiaceae bacterium]
MRTGLALLTLAVGAALASPVAAGALEDAVADTAHTPDEYLATFDEALLPGLGPIGAPPPITGNPEIDARIREIGEARGYTRRPEPTQNLVRTDGVLLQPAASAAWEGLQAAARAEGQTLILTSGYRSGSHQASLMLGKLTGYNDASIEAVLDIIAVPGYSKHHTGYALDMVSDTHQRFDFANSPEYSWLAENNFERAKAFGFIPSYPEGIINAGPNPEPWELVWVGATNIVCGDFEATPDAPFCDTTGSTFAGDIAWLLEQEITTGCRAIRFCTNDNVTRAQAATFLWRMEGMPTASAVIEFDDVAPTTFYTEAVRWMVEFGHTTGTSPSAFSPDDDLTREQFVTFLWRLAGRPAPLKPLPFDDVDPGRFSADAIAWAAEVEITLGTSPTEFSPSNTATRGQAAAFLHRYDQLDIQFADNAA